MSTYQRLKTAGFGSLFVPRIGIKLMKRMGGLAALCLSICGANASIEDPTDYTDLNIGTYEEPYLPTYPVSNPTFDMPAFSWDTIPRWIPYNLNYGYPPEEHIEALAKCDMVMFEKNNRQTLGSNEAGTADCAARVKAMNPDITTMFYWNATIAWNYYEANDNGFNQNYDDWTTPVEWSDYMMWYNLYLPEVREWWVESALGYLEIPNIDGLFVDNAFGSDYQPSFDENGEPAGDFVEMLDSMTSQVPDDKFVMGNTLRNIANNANRDTMQFLDGSYLESWNKMETGQSLGDTVSVTIQLMREASSRGKLINFRSGPSEADVDVFEEEVYFPLALFLMAAEEYSYFCYSHLHAAYDQWVWDTSWMDVFDKPLGEPLAPPFKAGDRKSVV